MTYNILLADQPREYLQSLDQKSRRIVKDNLRELEDEPYPKPGAGRGDREKIEWYGEDMYRMHIGRTHTAFYNISEEDETVRIIELLDIDEAHKKYDR